MTKKVAKLLLREEERYKLTKMDSNEAQQFQRNELKIQALLERVSGLTSEYENKDADRRIDITLLSQRVQQLEGELNEARGQLAEYEAPEEIVIEPDSD